MRSVFVTLLLCFSLVSCDGTVVDIPNVLSQVIDNFELKFADVYKKLESVKLELMEKDGTIQHLREKLAYQGRTINNLMEQLGNQRSSRDVSALERKARQQETVAFTAFLDHEIGNLGPNHIIPFGSVELNDGNGYNNHTGVFTAPSSGLYLFSFSVEDYHGHRIWNKLVVDSQLKASVVEWSEPGRNAQGSNTAVLRLKGGQSVWVAVDSREGDDSLQGLPNLRTTMFTDVENDAPSVPDLMQEILSPSGLPGETHIDMRPTRIADLCKSLDVNGRFSRLLPAVSTSFNFYDRSSICACTVPKAASTSIKRSLLVSEYPEKADFFRNLPGYKIHTQTIVENVTRDVCFSKSNTSFMVTRDPYTRLYSAYIDKIFLEKFHKYTVFIDLVLNKGVDMEEIADMRENDDDLLNKFYCGMTSVSFEQFLETVATASRLDIHFAPTSLVCKPCLNHFDIVVKQENLSSDLHVLYKTIYSSQKAEEYLSNYVGESGIESLVTSYYNQWRVRLSKHKCTLDKKLYNSINKRLWDALKLLGNIDENLEFIEELFKSPSGEKLKLRNPETILYEFKANHIPVLDRESRERQRLKYLEQAYQGIDRKVVRKIQRLFYLDFKLFDYNPVPPGL